MHNTSHNIETRKPTIYSYFFSDFPRYYRQTSSTITQNSKQEKHKIKTLQLEHRGKASHAQSLRTLGKKVDPKLKSEHKILSLTESGLEVAKSPSCYAWPHAPQGSSSESRDCASH